MKYALISDIHANLPALKAVLDDIERRTDVGVVYHLGDLVGYAPWPNEVVEMIGASGVAGVAGNYDSTVGTDYKHCGCRYEDPRQEELSHLSYAWTRRHVSPATKSFLAGLPFRIDLLPSGGHRAGPRVVLVHGTPTLNTAIQPVVSSTATFSAMPTAAAVLVLSMTKRRSPARSASVSTKPSR